MPLIPRAIHGTGMLPWPIISVYNDEMTIMMLTRHCLRFLPVCLCVSTGNQIRSGAKTDAILAGVSNEGDDNDHHQDINDDRYDGGGDDDWEVMLVVMVMTVMMLDDTGGRPLRTGHRHRAACEPSQQPHRHTAAAGQ